MSYYRTPGKPVQDPLERQLSSFVGVERGQPTETTCLPTALQVALNSIGAAASWDPGDFLGSVEQSIGPDGWNLKQLEAALRVARLPVSLQFTQGVSQLNPTSEIAYVLILVAKPIGHAVALTHEFAPGIFDPWPPGYGGVKDLRSIFDRWKAGNFPAIGVSLYRSKSSG